MSNLALFPYYGFRPDSTITFNTVTLNANTNDFGIVFQMPEAATITTIGWRQGTLTGTPGTLRVGLQGVSATTGLQNGTYLGGATNYVDYTGWAAGNNNTFITHTLPSSVSLTRGQLVCLYLDPQAVGTWNASNNVTVTHSIASDGRRFNRPYYFSNAAIQTSFDDEVYLLRSSTNTYGNPVQSFTSAALTNATNPDEIGLAFTLGSTLFSTYTVAGARVTGAITGAGGTLEVRLNNNTTVLQTAAVDTDQIYRFATNTFEFWFTNSSLTTLNTGTEYILSLKATSATANAASVTYGTYPTSGDISAISNQTVRYAERQGTGAWSFTNTTRLPVIELILNSTAFTGGGLLVHPGTAGGMRG